MSDPKTPGDPGSEASSDPATTEPAAPSTAVPLPPAPESPEQASVADSQTQTWPSLTPSSESAPSAASWGSPAATSPYEPADRLPEARIGSVADGATVTSSGTGATSRSRSGLRWGLAVAGILIVVAASALIVTLAGGRPVASATLGYMPASALSYSEIRMDLPGDQRQKLAAFLANFPGFKDQTQVQPKIDDVLDRIVRAASKGSQTWTTNIAPWFGGIVGLSSWLPDVADLRAMQGMGMGMGMPNLPWSTYAKSYLAVVTISDRAKAETWLTSIPASASWTKTTYNGADLYTGPALTDGTILAVAVTDKVLIGGVESVVKASVDTGGKGALGQDADIKAGFATFDRDYVMAGVSRTRALVEGLLKSMGTVQPGALDRTQLDETALGLVPAWQASSYRFESDAIVLSEDSPPYASGYDAKNHASALLDHVPVKTILYGDAHDVGPALTALIGKFRALPETKDAFAQIDQALSLLGGWDAVMGWWGDTAFAVAPGPDGVIGGGLLIQPRDKAAAEHLFTTFHGYLALSGSSTGINVREEDHGGTKIVIIDFSAAPGISMVGMPPGYKAEFAYAVRDDIVVLGYGRDFVAAVLDAGPGSNLASNERFKKLVGRVGQENIGVAFLDVNAIRTLIEPLIEQTAPASAWKTYQVEIQPYLEHLDALIEGVRKDGSLDRSTFQLTVH